MINVAVGKFVRSHIENIIKYCENNPKELENLQDDDYSRKTFKLSGYSFLKLKNLIKNTALRRYWTDDYKINNQIYKICSQWGGSDVDRSGKTKSQKHGQLVLNYLIEKGLLLKEYEGEEIIFIINNENENIIKDESLNRKYWVYAPGSNAKYWEEFYSKGIMGLGWEFLGDLNQYKSKDEIAEKLRLQDDSESSKKNNATANYDFKDNVSIGDIIIVKKGRSELLGYGVVKSDYYYDESREYYKKCRKVEWVKKGHWETGHSLVIKTLTNITNYKSEETGFEYYYERLMNIMETENIKKSVKTYPLNTILYGPPGTGKTYSTVKMAAEIISERSVADYSEAREIFNQYFDDRIKFITFHQNYSYEDFIQGLRPDVENNGSLSFERKDGVFKVISDKALNNLKLSEKKPETASKVLSFEKAISKFIDEIQDAEDNYRVNDSVYIFDVDEVSFRYTGDNWIKHKSGIRMKFSDLTEFYENNVSTRQDIKQLNNISGLAKQHATYYLLVYKKILEYLDKDDVIEVQVKRNNYVLIIDEINRANISRVFGELITLIEPDKRSNGENPLSATLPSGEKFIVPSNLYIIGTMNTADKSIALLDIALRRRFDFKAMYPIYEIDGNDIPDRAILEKINQKIIDLKGYDFQIGHSYFMDTDSSLTENMNRKVIPLLLEYFFNDKKEVLAILNHAGFKVDENSWPLKVIE